MRSKPAGHSRFTADEVARTMWPGRVPRKESRWECDALRVASDGTPLYKAVQEERLYRRGVKIARGERRKPRRDRGLLSARDARDCFDAPPDCVRACCCARVGEGSGAGMAGGAGSASTDDASYFLPADEDKLRADEIKR